ncbi:hypothetical protein PUN28_002169 [Cardiocondyla obscurior]|uniref:Uncharacterized protein n=1 Tax=Cardiocondyla obscurior TaxID=286306 RepID=A0AAW2GSW8_9HYME
MDSVEKTGRAERTDSSEKTKRTKRTDSSEKAERTERKERAKKTKRHRIDDSHSEKISEDCKKKRKRILPGYYCMHDEQS